MSPISSILPFIVVLIIALIREFIEDERKRKNDVKANSSETIIFKTPTFLNSTWKDLQVGNIIKIKKDEIVPADSLIIKSSSKNGLCYLQTTNLDGESTLKPREALHYTQENINEDNLRIMDKIFSCKNNNCFIEVDQPNMDIYVIEGAISFKGEKKYFSAKNVLLRGGRLKNVDYAYGIIIYTGNDTKIMKNINRTSMKFSNMDKKMNIIVIAILFIRFIIIFIFMYFGILFRKDKIPDYTNNDLKYEYLYYYNVNIGKKTGLEYVKIFVGHFVVTGTFIPISIVIMMAVTKVFQNIIIEFFEPNLKKDKNDQVKCLNSTLIEELGMIKYIFTDKTGTLTKNEMEFKACSIFTALFDDDEEISNDTLAHPIKNPSKFSKTFNKESLINRLKLKNTPLNIKNIEGCPFNSQGQALEEYFLNIAINHDVLAEIDEETKKIHFQGANPDEVTLVSSIDEIGFSFISREQGIIKIIQKNIVTGEDIVHKQYQILQKFDFSSVRQRSSIIVKDLGTNLIKIYIKGSDTKIFASINEYSKINILGKTKEHLDNFARRGLRTLCYSFNYIDEITYKKWEKKYNDLKYECITNKNKINDLEKMIEEIESDTILLGVSALEDKLQDEVKDDIQNFIESGINVWMITGDKMDTAESIGHSCKLIDDDTEVFKIYNDKNVENITNKLKEIKKKIEIIQSDLINFGSDEKKKKNNTLSDDNQNNNNNNDNNNNDNIFFYRRIKSLETPIINEQKKKINSEIIENDDRMSEILHHKKKENINVRKSDSINGESIGNMSILKFMIDGGYFENSNANFENLSIFQGNVRKASLSESMKNNEEILFNEKIGTQIENNEIREQDINIENIKENLHSQESKDSSDGETNENLEKIKRKNSRLALNLPTKESKFLEYFSYCSQKVKEYRSLNEDKLFLFKIPYIYGEVTHEKEIIKNKKKDKLFNIKIKYTLIIESEAISLCMSKGETEELFWYLIQRSRSLICCRSSPLQKAEIISFIKKKTSELTLSIGDGENDVNMIRTAHIGIGLFGKEGYQAAYNSDYAISQFKYLKNLLFIQGRFALLRNAYFIYNYFFKNVVYSGPLIYLCFYSGFSGTLLFDDFYHMGFNSFMAVLPILVRTIFEEDFDPDFQEYNSSEKKMLQYILPNFYYETRNSIPFNIIKYFVVFILGLIISFFCFIIPAEMFKFGIKGYNGHNFDFWELSFVSYLTILIMHFYYIYVDTCFINWCYLICFIGQIVLDLIFFGAYDALNYGRGLSGDTFSCFSSINFILVFILTLSITLIPFYCLRKFEFFFGGFIVNLTKQKRYEQIYIGKFYQKKVDQMIRATRSIAKFRKIYKEIINNEREEYDNLVDQQMKKIVKDFDNKRRVTKKNSLHLKK